MSKIESVLRFFFFLFFDGDSFFGNMIIHVDDFYGLGEGDLTPSSPRWIVVENVERVYVLQQRRGSK